MPVEPFIVIRDFRPAPVRWRIGVGLGRTSGPSLDAGGGGNGFTSRGPIVPSHRALGVVDAQPLQFGRQCLLGRVDGDDTDVDPFGEGRVDPPELDPSASSRLYQAENAAPLSPELEEEGMIFGRDPCDTARRPPRATRIDIGMMPPVDEPDGPFQPEVVDGSCQTIRPAPW